MSGSLLFNRESQKITLLHWQDLEVAPSKKIQSRNGDFFFLFLGFLFDQTRRFDIPYFSSGGIIVLSAIVFCLLYLPPFRRQMAQNKRDMEQQVAAIVAASSGALNSADAQTAV